MFEFRSDSLPPAIEKHFLPREEQPFLCLPVETIIGKVGGSHPLKEALDFDQVRVALLNRPILCASILNHGGAALRVNTENISVVVGSSIVPGLHMPMFAPEASIPDEDLKKYFGSRTFFIHPSMVGE